MKTPSQTHVLGLAHPPLPKYLLGFNQIAFPDFTKCFDFDTFDLQITLQSQYTSIAKPYESKAYHREWGMCQSEHMCLQRDSKANKRANTRVAKWGRL